jgi:hypothetical protein
MAGELTTGLLAVLGPGLATRSVSRRGATASGSLAATLRVENPVRAGLVEAVCAGGAVGAELTGSCVRPVLIGHWRATPATELTQVWVRVRSSGLLRLQANASCRLTQPLARRHHSGWQTPPWTRPANESWTPLAADIEIAKEDQQ